MRWNKKLSSNIDSSYLILTHNGNQDLTTNLFKLKLPQFILKLSEIIYVSFIFHNGGHSLCNVSSLWQGDEVLSGFIVCLMEKGKEDIEIPEMVYANI